jgi:pyruvyl transferase EpsO
MWRDERSLEIAQREFSAPSELCPDMAFCLGPLAPPRGATKRVVWLLRTDKESAVTAPSDEAAAVTDWLDEPATLLRRVNYTLMGAMLREPSSKYWRSLLMRTYTPLATQRLRRGLRSLSAGDVVITDRLHGHILSMLLGKPHVILDNTYGKLSSFHEKWTSGLDDVHVARTVGEARELAGQLAEDQEIASPESVRR